MDKLQQEAKKITDNQSGIEIVFDTARGIPYEEILKEQEAKALLTLLLHMGNRYFENLLAASSIRSVKRRNARYYFVRADLDMTPIEE